MTVKIGGSNVVQYKKTTTFTASFRFRGQLYRRGGFENRDAARHWEDTTRANIRRGETDHLKPRTAQKLEPLID